MSTPQRHYHYHYHYPDHAPAHIGIWTRFIIKLQARMARKALLKSAQTKLSFGSHGPVTLREIMGGIRPAPIKPSLYQRFLNLFR